MYTWSDAYLGDTEPYLGSIMWEDLRNTPIPRDVYQVVDSDPPTTSMEYGPLYMYGSDLASKLVSVINMYPEADDITTVLIYSAESYEYRAVFIVSGRITEVIRTKCIAILYLVSSESRIYAQHLDSKVEFRICSTYDSPILTHHLFDLSRSVGDDGWRLRDIAILSSNHGVQHIPIDPTGTIFTSISNSISSATANK